MFLKSLLKHIILAILTTEAKLVLKKYRPRIVAITGSVGKTSTKDAVYTIVKDSFNVRKSEKSFNSEFGLPLTILGLPTGWNKPSLWIQNIAKGFLLLIGTHPYPELLILEVGADHPGDIATVASWLPIDIAVITKIGDIPVHVEYYSSPEEVAKEKLSLLSGLKKGGVAVLNTDDPRITPPSQKSQDMHVVTYGIDASRDIVGNNITVHYNGDTPVRLSYTITTSDTRHSITLNHTIGTHNVYTTLAAFTVASTLGVDEKLIVERLGNITPTPGRLHVIEGIRGSILIDDTYNAAPAAMLSGLNTLNSLRTTGRKIAVLGDMLELGDYAEKAHEEVGARAAEACDILIVLGEYACILAESAEKAGLSSKHIHIAEDTKEVSRLMSDIISKGDCVFIKGSQGMRMEKVVKALMAHPEEASSLLVRQEDEWQK
ncbi:MAG: UDP-N-acetylmuramoyl-tripeptide--D-alanyl-D-alanine ligase [Parcubacteria group bacterium]|nr:UDP-N-acetylmuramoyl-tripeptide--D-alanyl-D-alanine ligase [Parcubacteria group bacterium]